MATPVRSAYAAPALAARLADRLQVCSSFPTSPMVARSEMNLADLTRAKPQLRIRTFAGEHLDVRPAERDICAPLPASSPRSDDRADRDIAQRQPRCPP